MMEEFGKRNGHVPITKVTSGNVGELNLCVQCGHAEDDHDFIIEEARAPIEMGSCLVPGCVCTRFDMKGKNHGEG
jgi:protein-arginine kinase activator protein McsA